MAKLYNLAKMTTATTGTGTITLGSAVTGFLSFASAGVSNGETITYAIHDGNNREIGRGVYTSSGTTLTRTVLKSTNSDSAINLSGSATVFITAAAEDLRAPEFSGTITGTYTLGGTPTFPDTVPAATSGVINNAALPTRLYAESTTVTNWNNATSNGWYYAAPAATNAPESSLHYMGIVTVHQTSGWITQTVHAFTSSSSSDTYTYQRHYQSSVWGSWYRLDQLATAAQVRAATSGRLFLTPALIESASALVSLTDAATISVDWDSFIFGAVALGGNRTLGNPTNGQPGTWRHIYMYGNDGTARTLSFGNQYAGDLPAITDMTNAKAYVFSIFCITTTHFMVGARRAYG